MYKHATNKEKIAILKEWLPTIIEVVKKDLKNDHLKKDLHFAKQYFPGKNIQKMTAQELAQGYTEALFNEENPDKLFDLVTYFWLTKNSEIYDFFEQALSKLAPDFTQIEKIDDDQSASIINDATNHFGAPNTYIFSVLNSVVFSEKAYHDLLTQAQKQKHIQSEQAEELSKLSTEVNDLENLKREIVKITEKYEKKLSGLQKKYLTDTEALKKQIAALQRQLAK